MSGKTPLYYTFGNHMHWVDMEWLWGYHVLPGSVADMLRFCRETGAKGNVNFDGVGYEKLAAEAPDALHALRAAVQAGTIEVVGASYGQPYGLFHGGESNIRQRVYGVRAVTRLLGVRPRTFWEEEFDFFPQLPQLLQGVGFSYASLFFQWTWHTPEVPEESLPAVWWEGMDGSRLLTAPKTTLSLHQWPEDFAALLASDLPKTLPAPGIVQWLELMPSPDWMCRAELMILPLQSLLAHPDYEVRRVTLSEYLEAARPHAEVRRYTLDDVFHGLSLGKNGDLFRRTSRRAEQQLLAAEALSSLAGLCGRPYASWDVYPTWELEEAWRELLAAQHHDNDECEGLCGHVGMRSYERSLGLSSHVLERTVRHLAERTEGAPGRTVVFNPLGWPRDAVVRGEDGAYQVNEIPAFGYRVLSGDEPQVDPVAVRESEVEVALERGAFRVVVNRETGGVTQLFSPDFPEGALTPEYPLGALRMVRGGGVESFSSVKVTVLDGPRVQVARRGRDGAEVTVTIALADEVDALDITFRARGLPRPDSGFAGALRTVLAANLPDPTLIHDHPYGVSPIRAQGTYRRKYPTGDWMTSPQVFEEVANPFTALQLLDLSAEDRGLLFLHDGSQSLLRRDVGVDLVLTLYDPWDEAYFVADLDAKLRVVPHAGLTHAERWRLAQEFVRPVLVVEARGEGGDLPAVAPPFRMKGEGVLLTACYRETEDTGRDFPEYVGKGLGYPFVLRLVEFNGKEAPVTLELPGTVANAVKTNLLGELEGALAVRPVAGGSALALTLRPFEIATVYLDLVAGRKVSRDLDARRSVWAPVHRTGESR